MNSAMIDIGLMNEEVKMLMDVLFGHLDTLQPILFIVLSLERQQKCYVLHFRRLRR